jgi:hypothetical protein
MSVSEGALDDDLDVLALLSNVFLCKESRGCCPNRILCFDPSTLLRTGKLSMNGKVM